MTQLTQINKHACIGVDLIQIAGVALFVYEHRKAFGYLAYDTGDLVA